MRRLAPITLTLIVLILVSLIVSAQPSRAVPPPPAIGTFSEQAHLYAGNPAANHGFGSYVAASSDGTTLLVGDYEGYGSGQGSAYVYVYSGGTWVQQAKLTASDGAPGDNFGDNVALSADGNTALVGAWLRQSQKGAAYVFVRSGTTWTEQAILYDDEAQNMDIFGVHVSLSADGNTAAVGAARSRGLSTGAAFVFTRSGTTWTEQARLVAATSQTGDLFGHSVALSSDGNTLLVGVRNGDGAQGDSGSAYVFVRSGDTWTEQATLFPTNGESGDWFASSSASLSGDGNTALIGAPQHDTDTGADVGVAYIFTRSGDTWTEGPMLLAADRAAGDWFGLSTALNYDGSVGLISARYADTTAGSDAGAAYVFSRSGGNWTQAQKLTASDGAAGDIFGTVAALSSNGSTAIISAIEDDTAAGSNAGSAYVFVAPPAIRADTVGIFRPSKSTFYLRNSNTTGPADITVLFGASTDLPVVGDWDYDGVDTIGLYRPGNNTFYLKNANTAAAPVAHTFTFGIAGELPVIGDWNGDGFDSVGVYANGRFFLRNTLNDGFPDFFVEWKANAGTQPLAGDWNGDGTDSVGVFNPTTAQFALSNQMCNCRVSSADFVFRLGNAGDVGFVGDWNADGVDGVGVFRPTNGITYLKNALTTGFADISMVYGIAGDKPLAGRWVAPPSEPQQAPEFVPGR